jgi:Protein of unknown function (DUF2971)
MQLYKYLTSEGALRLFQTGKVRFTQPVEFNDPFEMQPFLKGLADEPTLEKQFDDGFGKLLDPQIEELLGKLTPEQRSQINRESIQQMVLSQAPQALEAFKSLARMFRPAISREIYNRTNEIFGVFCLTEKPTNLLMWAHYAEDHRGVVIEFDGTHDFFSRRLGPQDDFRHLRRVTYTHQRPEVFLNDSDATDYFYLKSNDWEYEQEWRFVVPLVECSQQIDRPPALPICLFQLPSDCIRAVSIGVRMPETQKLELAAELRRNPEFRHIRVEQIDLDPRVFALHRREIRPDELDEWLRSMGKNQP